MVLWGLILLFFLHYLWLIDRVGKNLPDSPVQLENQDENKISIIIPFRNEARNLDSCIKSLKRLDYNTDLYEVIFVNDHSEDDFSPLLKEVNLIANWHLVNSISHGKKEAVKSGIFLANNTWVLLSDADCEYDINWLKECNNLISNNQSDLFVLPVWVQNRNGILNRFQYYDSLSSLSFNQGFFNWKKKTLLASGANLLYRKADFLSIDPFHDNNSLPSGDDMFLLEAFKKKNKKVCVSSFKGLWVNTKGENSWLDMIDQRIRWAKKMRFMYSSTSFLFGVYMFSFQLSLLFLLVSSFFSPFLVVFFILLIILKSIIDQRLINKMASINKMETHQGTMFVLEFVYLFIVPLIVILAIFRNPLWKGRKIKS